MAKNTGKIFAFGILAISVLIFIFYPDTLWNSAHEGLLKRVMVSYLVIPLLVGISLLVIKKFTFRSLVADSLIISAMKMVFTVTIFFLYISPNKVGKAPEITEESKTEIHVEHYKKTENFESGSLRGTFDFDSAKFDGVPVVALFDLKTGKSKSKKTHEVKITDCCVLPKVLLAQAGDKLNFENTTNELKPIYGKVENGKNYFQKAIPSGSFVKGVRLKKPAHVILDNNNIGTKLEEQNILIFTNPYYSALDSINSFKFSDVPTGKTQLGIWFIQGKNFIDLAEPDFVFEAEVQSGLETQKDFKIN